MSRNGVSSFLSSEEMSRNPVDHEIIINMVYPLSVEKTVLK
jgi:hypothetical protein